MKVLPKLQIPNSKFRIVFVLVLVLGCDRESEHFDSTLFSGVEVIGRRGAGAGELNKPRSLAIDRDDNLYVVDMTGRVQKFSPQGKFLLLWQMPQTDKGKPKGMCRDAEGNIVVLEPHYSRVNHFTPEGKLVHQWGTHGANRGELAFPRSVAVNSRGEIFVSEYGITERVQSFTREGIVLTEPPTPSPRFVRHFGTAGAAPGEFNRAEGLGIDSQDRIYVADSCNHRVQIFSPEGRFLATYGKPGSAPGEMSYPYDVRIDPQGFQYVCEFGNSRIQIFDPQHRLVEVLGGPGSAPGKMNNPWAIALDSRGNLYVADAGNHRVLKFIRKKESTRIQDGTRIGNNAALNVNDGLCRRTGLPAAAKLRDLECGGLTPLSISNVRNRTNAIARTEWKAVFRPQSLWRSSFSPNLNPNLNLRPVGEGPAGLRLRLRVGLGTKSVTE